MAHKITKKDKIRYAQRCFPSHIYKKWLIKFLSDLPEKEVKQLRQDMPAYLLIDS